MSDHSGKISQMAQFHRLHVRYYQKYEQLQKHGPKEVTGILLELGIKFYCRTDTLPNGFFCPVRNCGRFPPRFWTSFYPLPMGIFATCAPVRRNTCCLLVLQFEGDLKKQRRLLCGASTFS